MKRIRKSQAEPAELTRYKVRFAAAPRPPTWREFTADPRRREPVKGRLREDQRGWCAYCENRLVPSDESVEHFVPRSADHAGELDWSTLLLCCGGGEKPVPEDLPDGVAPVTNIGGNAFWGCTGLTSVTIPDRVTSIGGMAFSDCSGLTSVTIPGGVTSIGWSAFSGCTGLIGIAIPDSVTRIEWAAFAGCTGLTSVTIPNSVTSIEGVAFNGCTRLTGVYFEGNAPAGNAGAFDETPARIHFLPGTTGWGPEYSRRPTVVWQPRMEGIGIPANEFGFTVRWARGRTVAVEACTDLTQPVWSPVSTNTLTDGTAYFSDPDWAQYRARFYRVRGE